MDRLLRASQARKGGENHAEDPLNEADRWVVDVEQAEYVHGHSLRLTFSDGTERIVDFSPFLRDSLNPMIRKYLDRDRFRAFTVENGDLVWGDYELCFPVADLYDGVIR